MTKDGFTGSFDVHFLTAVRTDSFLVYKIRKNTGKTNNTVSAGLVRKDGNITLSKTIEV